MTWAKRVKKTLWLEAEAVVESLSEDNPSRLQLASVLRLQKALKEQVDAHPIVRDEEQRMSPEWQDAVAAIADILQVELDEVMALVQAAEGEEEGEGEGEEVANAG